MSEFGFRCENDSGHILISDQARSLHWIGDASFVERSDGSDTRGGYNLLRYEIDAEAAPVPFFTMPTDDAFYGVLAVRQADSAGRRWAIEIICSKPQSEHAGWPRVLCFVDAAHVTPQYTRWGMTVYDQHGEVCYDSRRAPLNVVDSAMVRPPESPIRPGSGYAEGWSYDPDTEWPSEFDDVSDKDKKDISEYLILDQGVRHWTSLTDKGLRFLQVALRMEDDEFDEMMQELRRHEAAAPSSASCGSDAGGFFTPDEYSTHHWPGFAEEPAYYYAAMHNTLMVSEAKNNSDSCAERWLGICVKRKYCSRAALYWTLYRSGIRRTGNRLDCGWIAVAWNCAWTEKCKTGWDETFMTVTSTVGLLSGNSWAQIASTWFTVYAINDVDSDNYKGGLPPAADVKEDYVTSSPVIMLRAEAYNPHDEDAPPTAPPADWDLDFPWMGWYWDANGNHVRLGSQPPPRGYDLSQPWQGYYWNDEDLPVAKAGPPSGWDLDLPYEGWFWDERGWHIALAPDPPPDYWDLDYPWEGFYWDADGNAIAKDENWDHD